MGEKLPFAQRESSFSGHAIELRINAEDVTENFRPAIGTITDWKRPTSSDIREDVGYRTSDTVPPFYDSLIGKVIVHAPTRSEAIYRTFQYLKRYRVEGVPTTIPFHAWILANPDFQRDGIDIGYVERCFTKEGAADALALLESDPLHRELVRAGEPFCEVIAAQDLQPGRLPAGAQSLVITHEEGGTFLAVPVSADGVPLDRTHWKRSNSRRGVE